MCQISLGVDLPLDNAGRADMMLMSADNVYHWITEWMFNVQIRLLTF